METRRSRMEQTRLQAPRGTWSSRPPLELGIGNVRGGRISSIFSG